MLYTVREVAQILKVAERTVYNWIEGGYLRAVQVDHKKTVRIRKEDLEEFLTNNLTTAMEFKTSLKAPARSPVIERLVKSLLEEGKNLG